MNTLKSALKPGDQLPAIEFGPISRHILALYCGGSGDHNPIHVDSDFAKAAGYDDVFAHGMLSMAVLGRLLTQWTDPAKVKAFTVRFAAITLLHDTVTASAQIADQITEDDEPCFILDIQTHTQTGTTTLTGSATIKIP